MLLHHHCGLEMDYTKLLLTVSGGLEGLAEHQVRACFGDELLLELKWHRKPSGSQLYLTLPMHEAIISHIAESMRRLDYVEYVYALLDSVHVPNDKDDNSLLRQIEEGTSNISQSSIDFCKRLCEAATAQTSGEDAGLEGLPGMLLPTPEVLPPSSNPPNTNCQEFEVNTIYTKPNVARAVIQTISEFCKKHDHNRYNNEKILWVDAGSGNGALLDHMPSQQSVGIDTHPTSPRVHQMDFLELSKKWLDKEFPGHEALFVVSNPPFSLSSRGDYTPIVQFINHSFDELGADIVAVICPSKFGRERIWRSLDMTERANILSRFFLPQNAFYNPCTGEDVHIHSYCLIFGCSSGGSKNDATKDCKRGVYLSAKRDKGLFPNLSTSDLTKSVVSGLTKAGVEFVAERNAQYTLNAKLTDSSSLELWWHINPQLPCSLLNSNSITRPNHSLGWISLSVKPPVALALASASLHSENKDCNSSLAINLMSGEGTIELEANRAVEHSFFLISGDKSHTNALQTAKRLKMLEMSSFHRPLVDVIVWDAQNLPLRRGIADAIIADLPIQGSLKKKHQKPKVGEAQSSVVEESTAHSLSYSQVLGEASRVLKAKGRAVLLSPDFKSLRHASSQFNWSQLGYSLSINLGGLNAKIFLMERKQACTKDLSMWVPPSTADLSSWIFDVSKEACEKEGNQQLKHSIVANARLHSTFFHEQNQSLSHCYRIIFDDRLRNVDAKKLERFIRQEIEDQAPVGIILR